MEYSVVFTTEIWVYDGGSYTPVAKLTEEGSYTCLWQNIALTQVKANIKCNNIPTLYYDYIVQLIIYLFLQENNKKRTYPSLIFV
ncbi:hypothetical protein HMPREF1869_00227 [Bacteroidales bacterium KA00251]|nr:hypothetical protein HMPREF1869_00227 [Bacteroidales bacterium KA00251]